MSRLNEILDSLLGIKVDARTIREEIVEAAAYSGLEQIQEMNTEFTALDTKASALIAHLSLMIAAVSILYGNAGQAFIKGVFLIEIILYVCTLLLVLRVIYYVYYKEITARFTTEEASTPEKQDEARAFHLMSELRKRMVYYRKAHYLTNIWTLILAVTLLLEFVLRIVCK